MWFKKKKEPYFSYLEILEKDLPYPCQLIGGYPDKFVADPDPCLRDLPSLDEVNPDTRANVLAIIAADQCR